MGKKKNKPLNSVIRAIRLDELKWSKARLAQVAGCSERTITNAENGKAVLYRVVTGIVDAFNHALREKQKTDDGAEPFTELALADAFDLDAAEQGTAKKLGNVVPPDQRRKMAKAYLQNRRQQEQVS